MGDQCECGGRIIPATKQITEDGPRYPLRDSETGERLWACAVCGEVVSKAEAAGGE